jgi:hypothetical protein
MAYSYQDNFKRTQYVALQCHADMGFVVKSFFYNPSTCEWVVVQMSLI